MYGDQVLAETYVPGCELTCAVMTAGPAVRNLRVSLWAELDGPISSALSRAAEDVRVRLAPGPRFGLDGTLERFLRLPFTLPAEELVEAVRRIAAVRYDLDRAARASWPGRR